MTDRLQRLMRYRYRISAQLYLALGGAVALTFAASLVGWFSFNQVGEAQNRVNEGSVPELAAAFDVAQHSQELVASADALTAATTADEVASIGEKISISHQLFNEQLDVLYSKGGEEERVERIHTYSNALLANIASLNDGLWQSFTLSEQLDSLQEELETLALDLDSFIVPEIDRQFFYIQTGYTELDRPQAPRVEHTSEIEQAQYRYLSELQSNAKIATQLIASAYIVSDISLIEPFRERFESSANNIRRNLSYLHGTPAYDKLAPIFDHLLELGLGQQNAFDLRAKQLELEGSRVLLLSNNHDIAVLLVDEVDALVSKAESGAQEATEASAQAILTGRTLLLAISFVSIGGALLIAWLYVGRVLLRRLELIAGWMRSLAAGDLDTRVEIGGRDEVAEMAAALEIFRHNAQEAIRLNLVEELAQELEGKNAELEGINARLDNQNHELDSKNAELENVNARLDSQNHELETVNARLDSQNHELDSKNHELEEAMTNLAAAQDRIVAQEKLASLGELTAGVAHEIRNPLNFVKNFSESSEELLEEMRETIDESEDGQLDDEQMGLIKDIFDDLNENLERIRSHGERANRIVQDMLMMGRESVTREMTNINNLLDEHARLAYHSARALDSEFQLDLQYDFEEMDDIEVNPRDVGRLFLNMVSNACYATDEKRRHLLEADPSSSYMPTLLLATRKGEEQVEVRIRDNGSGMPDEVIEKIFNPFFTTKPTGQGTGLGLSICNDIIREHGGVIEVESEPDEYTEMVISLPLTLPDTPVVEDLLDDDDVDDDDDEA